MQRRRPRFRLDKVQTLPSSIGCIWALPSAEKAQVPRHRVWRRQPKLVLQLLYPGRAAIVTPRSFVLRQCPTAAGHVVIAPRHLAGP